MDRNMHRGDWRLATGRRRARTGRWTRLEGNREKVMVTSDDGGVRLVLTSGGVMTFDRATVECRPVTGKTHKKGRADVVICDALESGQVGTLILSSMGGGFLLWLTTIFFIYRTVLLLDCLALGLRTILVVDCFIPGLLLRT
ncbi:hypothetical protein M378DRAFT_154691, partial [Amanita muscaria Koide BX008]